MGMMLASHGTKVPKIDIHLGMRLAAARQEASVTQERIAEMIGVSRRTITRWESTGESVPLGAMLAYSVVSDVNLGWIQTGVADLPSDEYAGIIREDQAVQEALRLGLNPAEVVINGELVINENTPIANDEGEWRALRDSNPRPSGLCFEAIPDTAIELIELIELFSAC